ncbi:MAG: 50S ribosomal protein L29 [Pegethrix bostrychoides GSE-TBD4-15B]|jgi:large subunit ribosomal protein L29|uniref:Large ribosomal subunit protein uL29 n=1 Tax=Pegethrix bostrychoides GSE-TBD4-15B TaxID=2839662 RepID=A0A951PG81_9CYAN|nr:50S ribosomal protein L29 [Pegethrix bostrychoides GSE-TBD4-15B]
MPLPKIEEVRELNDQELNDRIAATKKELFQLRFQKATRQLEKPHQFKHLRHRLAQLMTLEQERKLAQSAGQSAATPED